MAKLEMGVAGECMTCHQDLSGGMSIERYSVGGARECGPCYHARIEEEKQQATRRRNEARLAYRLMEAQHDGEVVGFSAGRYDFGASFTIERQEQRVRHIYTVTVREEEVSE